MDILATEEMTQITISDKAPDYWKGCFVKVGGNSATMIITAVSGNTLTIAPARWVDRFKSRLSYLRWKVVFFFYDIADEIQENIDAFNEWRKM